MPVGRHASTLSTSAACPLARGVSASDFPPIRRNYLPPPHGNRMRVASARRTRQGVRHTGSERTPPRTPPEVHAEIKRRPRSVVASAPPPVRRLDFADFPFLAAILVRGTLSTERNKGAPPPSTCPSPSRLESLAPFCPLRVAPRNATRSRPDRPRTKPDRRVSGAMDRGTVGRGSVREDWHLQAASPALADVCTHQQTRALQQPQSHGLVLLPRRAGCSSVVRPSVRLSVRVCPRPDSRSPTALDPSTRNLFDPRPASHQDI